MTKLRKAVFPVAGFGTRFLPATKAMPKELLPIVDKPLIQYAAEEAISAGIDTLIFVTGRNKRAIEDHFDNNQELEMALRAKGKYEQADMVKNILPAGVECIFMRQPEQLGLGHAVLCAERAVGVDPFAVLLADDFSTSGISFDGGLLVHNGQHPRLLRLLLQKKIRIQTAVVLDNILSYCKNWSKEIKERVVWPHWENKIVKLKPFMSYNQTQCKLIMKEVFVNGK